MAVGGPQHELSLSLSPTLTLPLSLTLTCSLARGLAHHQARVSSNGGGEAVGTGGLFLTRRPRPSLVQRHMTD